MLIIKITFILLNCFSLSFQTIKSGLFCDDRIYRIYVYDESLKDYRILKILNNPEDCYNVDYVDLDVDPGALIKFQCYNGAGETLGGGCFLINNKCHCYDFDNTEGFGHSNSGRSFSVYFNNGISCNYYARFLQDNREDRDYYYYHHVPLDVNQIKCNPKTISAPINIKRSLKFSEYIESPFKATYLKIRVNRNYQIFTLNNQQLSSYTKFNILNDLEFSYAQSSKINIQFINYGVVLDNTKTCEFNIRFCYNSCLECKDIDPNEASHQCLKCKDDFYFIENTTNCMTIDQMKDNHSYYFDRKEKIFKSCYDSCEECNDIEPNKDSHQCLKCKDNFYFIENTTSCKTIKEMENSSYYFDKNETIFRLCYDRCEKCNDIEPNETSHQCSECKEYFYFIENTSNCMTIKEMENSSYYFDDNDNEKIFRHCLNECSTCYNETYCSKCSEGYHFIYNDIGKCISEPKSEDLLYLDDKTNTYKKCDEGTVKVENNICIKKSYTAVIVISSIVFIIIIIVLLFFCIKKIVSNKKNEIEIPNSLGKNNAENQLINTFL